MRGEVEIRAVADPERSSHEVTFERKVSDGDWTAIGTDNTSPAYTVFDDVSALGVAAGTTIAYRATLTDGSATVVSDVRTVQMAGPPTRSTCRHQRTVAIATVGCRSARM